MRVTMKELEVATSSSMSSPIDGYNKMTFCTQLSVTLYLSIHTLSIPTIITTFSTTFLPYLYLYIYMFRAYYKYSLNRHIGTYLQICPCFRFSSDSVEFLPDPFGSVSFSRFVGSHSKGPVSQQISERKGISTIAPSEDELLLITEELELHIVRNESTWVVDSGASYHLTPNWKCFSSYRAESSTLEMCV